MRLRAIACLCVTAMMGCRSGGASPDEPSRPGALGNPCRADLTCDTQLVCDVGFCVPADCGPRGSEGCACHAEGTCDASLSCLGNICVAVSQPAPGSLGGACSDDIPCDTSPAVPRTCVDGMCERAGSASGTIGNPCGPLGACAPLGGAPTRCFEGLCTAGAGVCGDNGCAGPQVVELAIASNAVRACDVVIELGAARVASVAFAAQVRGASAQRDSRIALSFASSSDSPMGGEPATLQVTGDRATMRLAQQTCVDGRGAPVADAGIVIR